MVKYPFWPVRLNLSLNSQKYQRAHQPNYQKLRLLFCVTVYTLHTPTRLHRNITVQQQCPPHGGHSTQHSFPKPQLSRTQTPQTHFHFSIPSQIPESRILEQDQEAVYQFEVRDHEIRVRQAQELVRSSSNYPTLFSYFQLNGCCFCLFHGFAYQECEEGLPFLLR